MLRSFACAVSALTLMALLLETSRAQQAGADRIYYRDPANRDGPQRSVEGQLKASPAGYQLIADGKVKTVLSPSDIIRVVPGNLPGLDKADIEAQKALEINEEWEKARQGYEEMQKKARNPQESTRRYLDYKLAMTTARAADAAADETAWNERAGKAIDLLDKYLLSYPNGWEMWSAARTDAHLQMARIDKKRDGDKETVTRFFDDAARTWGRVVKSPEMPADLRHQAAFHEIDALVRGHNWGSAGDRLKEATKTAAAGAPRDRLAICQIVVTAAQSPNPLDAVPKIEAEIAHTKDPVTRAVGHSMLGELYLIAGKPREAMWAFLWVEVVYNQDPDEVAKALFRLAEIFALQGDEERAKSYQDKARLHRSSL
jgi:hypothetical protein